MKNKIVFSSRGQSVENHGRKPHMVFRYRFDGACLALGVAYYTRYRKWCAELDNLRGGRRSFEADTLAELRTQVRTAYGHITDKKKNEND